MTAAPRIILVTGGARSGKSTWAEGRVRGMPGAPIYIATAEPRDAEMAARIARHREVRGQGWRTEEAPLALAATLRATDGAGPRLVDCLTLWLSNVMLAGLDWEAEAGVLAAALEAQVSPVVLVTNEVGAGIVPENALARAFRDAAGLLNQRVAVLADEVVMTVAGLPLVLKGPPPAV